MNQEEEDLNYDLPKLEWGQQRPGLAIVIPSPEDSVKNNFGDITIVGLIENFPLQLYEDPTTIEGEELKYQNFLIRLRVHPIFLFT